MITDPSTSNTRPGWPFRSTSRGTAHAGWVAWPPTSRKRAANGVVPVTGRRAARTLPPPSVHTTTSSASSDSKPVQVAGPARHQEAAGELASVGTVGVEAPPGGVDPPTGPRHQLPTGRLGAARRCRRSRRRVVEDVVQEKGGAFDRLELLEEDEEGQRQRVGQLGALAGPGAIGLQRLRQPRSFVGLAARSGRPQLVDAQSGHDRRQIGRRGGRRRPDPLRDHRT
jgi:hypothetical protein